MLLVKVDEIDPFINSQSTVLDGPDTLEMPAGYDQLLQTFDIVDAPKSIVSLSTLDSFQQTPADTADIGKLKCFATHTTHTQHRSFSNFALL